MARNYLAIVNAIALALLYLYLTGSMMGLVTKDFNVLFIPIMIVAFVAEMMFIIKQFMKN